MSIFIGEGNGQNYSAMRGPCPIGFHIPMDSEWQDVLDILTTIGYDNDSKKALCFMIILLMPFAGQRDYSTSNPQSQDGSSYGIYWCSTNNYRCIDIRGTSVQFKNYYKGYGYLIRPFKDVAVVPDSSWTKVDSYQVAIGGIYKNTTLGLISLSGDGTNWITITDKNLGATEAYDMNSGYYTEANCGKYFQWGNNYGFPFTGSLTTSSTQVNASDYGPGNYYNSSTFITQQNWDSSVNNNLWGGETGITKFPNVEEIFIGEGIDDYSAMRGPCPEGFHVMRTQDFTGLKTIMESLSLTISDWSAKLKIPLSGDYGAGGSRYGLGERRGFKACDNANQYGAYIYGSKYPDGASTNRKSAHPIRPFKDKYETPTSSRTVIEGTLGSAGIFRDETNGLISITDGTNGYTITDKNLGATVVFNSGDSESANNVGNYYQWGNNYGFSYGRSESTSSSQVDASQYGPGNYYSDNTFRTGANPAYWDSSINTNLRGGQTGITKKGNVIEVYQGTTKIRPDKDYLCFTANTAGSTIQLIKVGSITSRTFEISTDKHNWTTYTIGDVITLGNIGDKVYRRSASNSAHSLATSVAAYHQFVMTGSIAGSGDIGFLLKKDGYSSVLSYSFTYLFMGCTALTTPPKLPATSLAQYCYFGMFQGTGLTVAPELPATTLAGFCYRSMFEGCASLTTPPKLPATTLVGNYDYGYMFKGCTNLDKLVELPAITINTGSYSSMYEDCSKIKLSTTKTGDYQTEYRIPTTGTGTVGSNALLYMIRGTGGTATSINVNTTYYTSNTVV